MHNFVALTVFSALAIHIWLTFNRRVYLIVYSSIKILYACCSSFFSVWRKHYNIIYSYSFYFLKKDLIDFFCCLFKIVGNIKDKVISIFQIIISIFHKKRIKNNMTVSGLPFCLCKSCQRNNIAVDQIIKHSSCSNGRKLIYITHKHYFCARLYRLKQLFGNKNIKH